MPTPSVTITPAESCILTPITQVDSTGTPLAPQDATYGAATFTNTNTATVTMVGARATFGGTFGTAVITATETSTDPTKPAISGSVTVTFQGPAAAALTIGTLVQQGN